jgi:oligopeptide/dipeptide ABC transporter ATP-binding protein|tara:strand:+ start:2406 stop:3401 length:996 start_codon:yes stop_codon:yes gene_type:complete
VNDRNDQNTTQALIEVQNLRKHFYLNRKETVHAVDDISFDIQPNEILGLVGESGSGKSTLGKTILGLHPKTSGRVYYKNEALPKQYQPADFRRFARTMQMIFQDPYSSLNPRMTIGEIIGEGLKLHTTMTPKSIQVKTAEWLEKVGLSSGQMSRYAHEFSGGQRQRIGIARALIVQPEFVICDEPLSALDVSVQAQVVNLLESLKSSMGLTLLFIAHDLSIVRYISDRMAVMYLGSLVEIGPTDQVFFEPKHPYTRLLIDSNPEPDPRQERYKKRETIHGEIASPINIGRGCRFVSRCPKAMKECYEQTPTLQPTHSVDTTKHAVACHLYH